MASTPDSDAVRRQLHQRLRSLSAAGVDWLPQGPALEVEATTPLFPADEIVEATGSAAPATEDRRIALAQLADEVRLCTRCPELCSTRTQTVFGDGQAGAELCFVGEAPGEDEDRQGLPFVGAAGQLLNKIIEACGMKREEVYIMNVIKCHPPRNRTPLPNEAANCRSFFDRQLDLVRPKYICALGGCAAS